MTFTIHRQGSWRYYGIDGKKIISIAFFNRDGIVVQTEQGWLEKGGKYITAHKDDVNPLIIEKEPIRKLKPNFQELYDNKQPFYAIGNILIKGCVHENGYILYLPYIPEEWSVSTEYWEHATEKGEYCRYVHKTGGYVIHVYIKSIPIEDNVNFVKKVREIFELAIYNKRDISDSSIIENRKKITELIEGFSAK
jgi:hypothetical protein